MLRNSLLIHLFLLGMIVPTGSGQTSTEKVPVGELLYSIIEEQGVDAAVARYEKLIEQESDEFDLSEVHLNNLGYRLLNEGRYEACVAIFKLNTRTYPASINVWDSLAEGYFAAGNRKLAEKNYKKVISMVESASSLPPRAVQTVKNRVQLQLQIVQHLDPASEADIHYVSYFGGPRAGKWDVQNIIDFKSSEGIKVSYRGNNVYRTPVPGNVKSTLTGPNRPDVMTGLIAGDYRRFIEQGIIKEISGLWQDENWDSIFPEPFKNMASYGGKQYFIPMAYQWNPIWYRKDIFEKHGLIPPETWEELLNLCDRLNDLGYTPFTIGVQNWPPPVARWFTILNLRLNGPEFHDQVMRGKIAYSDKRLRDVLIHWRELFRQGAFADDSHKNNYRMAMNELITGEAVMYNLGEWIFEGLDPKHGQKLDFFAFPELKPSVTSSEIVHTYGAFMTTDSSDPVASKTLLKWMASPESQQSNASANNRVVANSNVNTSLYSNVQRRIVQHVNKTEVLVPLFEFNTHPAFARKAFAIFKDFWEKPEVIEKTLQKLESARREVFINN